MILTKVIPVLQINMDGQELTYRLEQSRYEIGRSIQCSLQIHHKEVSRLQATLIRDAEGHFQLLDGDGLGTDSSNGTYVNGVRIRRRTLHPGDVIHFGSSTVSAHYLQGEDLMVNSPTAAVSDHSVDDGPTQSMFPS